MYSFNLEDFLLNSNMAQLVNNVKRHGPAFQKNVSGRRSEYDLFLQSFSQSVRQRLTRKRRGNQGVQIEEETLGCRSPKKKKTNNKDK
jgi:hypothetical protein